MSQTLENILFKNIPAFFAVCFGSVSICTVKSYKICFAAFCRIRVGRVWLYTTEFIQLLVSQWQYALVIHFLRESYIPMPSHCLCVIFIDADASEEFFLYFLSDIFVQIYFCFICPNSGLLELVWLFSVSHFCFRVAFS